MYTLSLCMRTSSNGIIFRVTALCERNSPVNGEFPKQRPVARSFDVFFDLCLNKRLYKPWRRGCFETPLRSLWCYCNGHTTWLVVILPCQGPRGFLSSTNLIYSFFRRHTTLWLTHVPLAKMVVISQTIFSYAFSWMKSFAYWWKFHWSLFLKVELTIAQHWFRYCISAE